LGKIFCPHPRRGNEDEWLGAAMGREIMAGGLGAIVENLQKEEKTLPKEDTSICKKIKILIRYQKVFVFARIRNKINRIKNP